MATSDDETKNKSRAIEREILRHKIHELEEKVRQHSNTNERLSEQVTNLTKANKSLVDSNKSLTDSNRSLSNSNRDLTETNRKLTESQNQLAGSSSQDQDAQKSGSDKGH